MASIYEFTAQSLSGTQAVSRFSRTSQTALGFGAA